MDAISPKDFGYDAIFIPGGHGIMFDGPGNPRLRELVEAATAGGRVVSAVCHGPAGLVGPRGKEGEPLVKGKRVGLKHLELSSLFSPCMSYAVTHVQRNRKVASCAVPFPHASPLLQDSHGLTIQVMG